MSLGSTRANLGESQVPLPRTVDDVTCLACGCLCDDLGVSFDGASKVVDVTSACALGRNWFLRVSAEPSAPISTVEGREVGPEEAVDRAVSILTSARSPVVWGLTRTVTESVCESLGLAEILGARVVLDRSPHDLGRVAAFQDQGRVTATLGEVKNRADVVIFWGANPVVSHPRHWERYSVEPRGRFLPEGRCGRTVVVVDSEKTETADQADLFIHVKPDLVLDTLTRLRLMIAGKSFDTQSEGYDREVLERLVTIMKSARYGALFFRSNPFPEAESSALWDAASRLVRDLNDHTRFVLLGMGASGNLTGAESALTWQTGYLQGVDFRLGYPRPLDDLATLDAMLVRREVDAVLAIDGSLPENLSEAARESLARLPTVVIGPRATISSQPPPTVALAASTPGFDVAGMVTRSDGVSLPLRPVTSPSLPSDRDWIRRIIQKVRDRLVIPK